jgi:hypothetical protein
MGRVGPNRPAIGARGTILAAALCAALAVASFSCKDDPVDPPPGPAPSSLSFILDDSTQVSFSGEGAWPPSGSGVIARMDSARTTLQVAAYSQTSGKPGATGKAGVPAGPEPRFTMVLFEISSPGGIHAGLHFPSVALFGGDIALREIDSFAYFGTTGLFSLTSVTEGRVAGTFSGVAMRPADSATISIGSGAFDAALETGLLSFSDTGSAGGTIAISVDTGATPLYGWTGGPVNALGIARASSPNALVWGIVTAGGDSILTGVTHGQVPAGAVRLANAEPALTPGVAYRITVSRVGGSYGYRVFVP